MNSFYLQLEKQLCNDLKKIENTVFSNHQRYEQMAKACSESYLKLKERLKQHKFPDQQSEIHFFKNINPQAISKIHFYSLMVNHIGVLECLNTPKERKCQCKKMLKQTSIYNANNQHIISYYKSSCCSLDEKYFLRANSNYPILLEDCLALLDKETSTGYDLIIARYIAYSQFAEFLSQEIRRFSLKSKTPELGVPQVLISWTGSKSEATELIYAFHGKGSFNNGQASISEITKGFEVAFQVSLGDVFRTQNENKHRNNPTLYLDNLKKAAIEKNNEKEF